MDEKAMFVCFILALVACGLAVFFFGERMRRKWDAEDAAALSQVEPHSTETSR